MAEIELAKKIIALGIGRQGSTISCDGVGFFYTPGDEGLCAELFIRDWSVAGALIEKCKQVIIGQKQVSVYGHNYKSDVSGTIGMGRVDINESIPLAVNEACIEALENE